MKTRIISCLVTDEEYRFLNEMRAKESLKENKTVSISELIRRAIKYAYNERTNKNEKHPIKSN